MAKPAVAVCQMTATHIKEDNWKTCEALLRDAKAHSAKMAFLPECFDFVGRNKSEVFELAEEEDGPSISKFKNIAHELSMWISLGGFHEKCPGDPKHVYNTHLIVNDQGETVLKYHKLHLFDVDLPEVRLRESEWVVPGKNMPEPVSTPIGRLGVTTCYDLRFPELPLLLRGAGAEVLAYPSAFTITTGMAHWEVLLRSRAIDAQCYVVSAAQSGRHNEHRSSYGHAMIVDPWGTVVAQCTSSRQPQICVANIDLSYLEDVRQRLPVELHRRHDMYSLRRLDSRIPDESSGDFRFGEKIIPSSCVFYVSSKSYAFVNRKPVVTGHTLVASVRKADRFIQLTSDEVSDLHCTVQKVQKMLEKHYGVTSSSIVIQDGPEAGQTVKHVHVHILPRRANDFPNNDDIYSELQRHDKGNTEEQWRSLEDMSKEATLYRDLMKDYMS